MITLEEMKQYLRAEYDDDDALLQNLIDAAIRLCMDIARTDSADELSEYENARIAVLYAAAYMYEHREEADHHQLVLTLRSLLFSAHEGGF